MPDFTMCYGKKCRIWRKCYRYMADPSQFQSWGNFEDTVGAKKGECGYFYPYQKLVKEL